MTDQTPPFTITIDDSQVQRWFGELLQRAQDQSGLMADVREYLIESTQGRFATGIGPDGIAWAPLADGSGRTPLLKSGRMRDGVNGESGPDWVEIYSDARQARWHQEGTKPYEIHAKPGKALFWPGMRTRPGKDGAQVPAFVRKVNHPGLPARPFMGISSEDDQVIGDLAIAWLELGESGSVG